MLSRNPAWKQSTDPLRHQYVSQIVVTEGTSSDQTMLANVQAGTDDLMWDLPVPTPSIPQLQASKNPGLHIYTDTGSSNPFLVFNLKSPTDNHALGKLKVRQAIEYAINKVALAKIYGGTKLNPVLNGAIAPGNIGYANYNYYPTPGNSGDPAKCKSMLAAAGYPHGLTLTDVYRNVGNHPAIFTSVQASLKACGITSKGSPQEQGPYYAFIENPANASKWDISEPGWAPDWLGNNGRANVVPLCQTNCTNPTVNERLLQQRRSTDNVHQAGADRTQRVGRRAAVGQGGRAGDEGRGPVVPFMTQDVVLFAGPKVHNLIYSPIAENWNPTQIWLSH